MTNAQEIIDLQIEQNERRIAEEAETAKKEAFLTEVTDTLAEAANQNEEVLAIRNIVESNEVDENAKLEEGEGTIAINPETGVTSIMPDEAVESETKERPVSTKSLTELTEEYTPTTLPVLEDELNEKFKNEMNLSDEDAAQLLSVIQRHAAGERFAKFNALPDSVKEIIRKAGAEVGVYEKDALNFFTNTMLDEFITDANFNKEVVNFEEAIKKELNIPSIVDMHSEYIRDAMEKDLLDRADKLEEKGESNKADALRKVSAAFTSAYTYDKVYDILAHNRKVRSRLAKDVDKYKRFCDDFVYKFRDTDFNIHDIAMCLPVLKRKFPHRSERELVMFVNTIWKSIDSMDIKLLENNIYAYYIIKNIMSLDYIDIKAPTEFTALIMENIENVIDKINDYVADKAAYDAKIEEERQAKKGGRNKNGNIS